MLNENENQCEKKQTFSVFLHSFGSDGCHRRGGKTRLLTPMLLRWLLLLLLLLLMLLLLWLTSLRHLLPAGARLADPDPISCRLLPGGNKKETKNAQVKKVL